MSTFHDDATPGKDAQHFEKATHPNCGEVEIVTRGELESLVRLQSGELRTVTTAWLKPIEKKDDGTDSTKPA